MVEVKRTFAELIEKDRAEQGNTDWRGTFLDYLDKVKQDPSITKLAHARMYGVVMQKGVMDITECGDPKLTRLFNDEPLKVYNFFKDEFFGIERSIAQIAR